MVSSLPLKEDSSLEELSEPAPFHDSEALWKDSRLRVDIHNGWHHFGGALSAVADSDYLSGISSWETGNLREK